MRNLLMLLMVALVCLSLPAMAAPDIAGAVCMPTDAGTVLQEVALNGAAATRTITIGPTVCGRSLASYQTMTIETDFTYAHTGTITWTCTQGPDASRAVFKPTTCTTTAGTCTLSDAGVAVSPSRTASSQWGVRFGVAGYPVMRCTASHSSGSVSASDKLTAFVILSGV